MELNYQIVRSSRRKKVSISVERDCLVVVHAPANASDEAIHQIVATKRQWLYEKLKHPQKYQDRPHPPGKEVVNGESVPFLGRDYPIKLTETASGEVEFERGFQIPLAHQAKRKHVLKEWYLKRAAEIIFPRVERHAAALGVGHGEVKLVDDRYRWGSCTAKRRLRFNWRLVKAPMFVIDYVIVHELAHLLEANHSSRFWNIVRAKAPSTEKARLWLKEHGQLLQEEL